ncbi:MAG: phosphoribulokinase [Solirubrobacteraceae bacterium]
MQRPVLLGIAGDSAAGKTTLTRGLVRILGAEQVTHLPADHYHRYERQRRLELGLTPLNPEANYLDMLEQHLLHLRAGEAILKPAYSHRDGMLAAAEHVRPAPFVIVEGLLPFHTRTMREVFDVRVYLDPPEDLRRRWKVQRDCSRRGYTTDQVLEELDRRELDSATFIRPQRIHADIVICFRPGDRGDEAHLDAKLTMRPGLVHCDLSPFADRTASGIAVRETPAERTLLIPGTIGAERSARIEAAVWECMHFASHLRTERLGEFTIGTELNRSESLAIAQLLVLYQLVTARAALALGAEHARADRPQPAPDGSASAPEVSAPAAAASEASMP